MSMEEKRNLSKQLYEKVSKARDDPLLFNAESFYKTVPGLDKVHSTSPKQSPNKIKFDKFDKFK